MVKRNDVVSVKTEFQSQGGFWHPFGRVNKIFDDGNAQIITVLKDVETHPILHLEVHDYKGFWNHKRGFSYFVRMPSLRKLKQLAQIYHPEIWKRPKKINKRG